MAKTVDNIDSSNYTVIVLELLFYLFPIYGRFLISSSRFSTIAVCILFDSLTITSNFIGSHFFLDSSHFQFYC